MNGAEGYSLQRLRKGQGQPFKNGVIPGVRCHEASPAPGCRPSGGGNRFSRSSSQSGTPERPVRLPAGVWKCRCPPWEPAVRQQREVPAREGNLPGRKPPGRQRKACDAGKGAVSSFMKRKTAVHPIQTHLFGLSRFPGRRGLVNLPSPGFPGKNHPSASFFAEKACASAPVMVLSPRPQQDAPRRKSRGISSVGRAPQWH